MTRRLIVSAAFAFLAFAPLSESRSWAQNALGGGNALDANPGGGGQLNTTLPIQDYRARNLLITGNVAGGRGFQGAVGYAAEGDFTGRLGSDDLFGFRAGSALSAADFVSIGRSADRFAYGQDLGLLEYRRTGSTTGGAMADLRRRPPSTLDPAAPPVRLDRPLDVERVDQMAAAIHAQARMDLVAASLSSSAMQEIEIEPQTVGIVTDQQGQQALVKSSPLRGLRFEDPRINLQALGLGTYDLARSLDDWQKGSRMSIGSEFNTSFETLENEKKVAAAQDAKPVDTHVDTHIDSGTPSGTEAYRQILENIAHRYAGQENVHLDIDRTLISGLEKEYRELREQLIRSTPNALDEMAKPGIGPEDPEAPDSMIPAPGSSGTTPSMSPSTSVPGSRPGTIPGLTPSIPSGAESGAPSDLPTLPGSGTTSAIGAGASPTSTLPSVPGSVSQLPKPLTGSSDPATQLRPDMTPDEAAQLTTPNALDMHSMSHALRHGQQVTRLSSDDTTRFNELMSTGEQAMRNGEYFYAERRFVQALRYTPNHPLAGAGVGHAQLGAGLHLSSSLTLRSLLTAHPEMIDTRYEAKLLPPAARMQEAAQILGQRMNDQRVRLSDRVSSAFLLAYIGHQVGDRAMVARGLDTMDSLNPPETFQRLLRNIWLADQAAKPQAPAVAPAPVEESK